MKMNYNEKGEICFNVHKKENQKLKYLPRQSCHIRVTFDAIPKGVLNRLINLKSHLEDTKSIE